MLQCQYLFSTSYHLNKQNESNRAEALVSFFFLNKTKARVNKALSPVWFTRSKPKPAQGLKFVLFVEKKKKQNKASQRKVWFDLFEQNQKKRKTLKKKHNLRVGARLQLADCHYAIKVLIEVGVDMTVVRLKPFLLAIFVIVIFCSYVLFCIVFRFFFSLFVLFCFFFWGGGRGRKTYSWQR